MMATRSHRPLCLLHEVSRQEDGLAAVADAPHEVPDGPPGLRVEAGGELVEEHQLGRVDQGQGDEQPLLLSPGQRHEPRVALVGESELIEQPVSVERRVVEGGPQVHRLPDLDPFLELRLLELHADAGLEGAGVPDGVEPEDLDASPVGPPQALDALHGRGLPGPVRSDQTEDLAGLHLERDIVHGHRLAVGLPDAGDADHRGVDHAGVILPCAGPLDTGGGTPRRPVECGGALAAAVAPLAGPLDTGRGTVCNGAGLGVVKRRGVLQAWLGRRRGKAAAEPPNGHGRAPRRRRARAEGEIGRLETGRFAMRIWKTLAAVGCAFGVFGMAWGLSAQQPESKVFELRVYKAVDGKRGELSERFRDHTSAMFEQAGMENVGYWNAATGDDTDDTFVYMLGYPTLEARDEMWGALGENPEFQRIIISAERSEDRKLVDTIDARMLVPTEFLGPPLGVCVEERRDSWMVGGGGRSRKATFPGQESAPWNGGTPGGLVGAGGAAG